MDGEDGHTAFLHEGHETYICITWVNCDVQEEGKERKERKGRKERKEGKERKEKEEKQNCEDATIHCCGPFNQSNPTGKFPTVFLLKDCECECPDVAAPSLDIDSPCANASTGGFHCASRSNSPLAFNDGSDCCGLRPLGPCSISGGLMAPLSLLDPDLLRAW